MTFAGWSSGEVGDLLIKLSPAVTIVFGLLAAQVQWRRQQRLNALLIAKNHYREMLEQMMRNAELLERGSTQESLAELRRDPIEYSRYTLLFAQVSFALQEIYFATDPAHEKHWAQAIKIFFDPFRHFMASGTDFTDEMSSSVDPKFSEFIRTLFQPR